MKIEVTPELQNKMDKYYRLLHAMQSGVKMSLELGSDEASHKHLRVGVNSAMVETSTIAQLLVDKGIITYDEFYDMLIVKLQEEVDRYKVKLSQKLNGTKVDLV